MTNSSAAGQTEYWQRGPVPGIPGLLQPVAHTLLQVQQEVHAMAAEIDPGRLWEKPAGLASAGFHLRHMSGVLDRLFTYADGGSLTPEQFGYLAVESTDHTQSLQELIGNLDNAVSKALKQLAATDPLTLTEIRLVGRKKIQSTQIGLYFHSAEHLMRHTGQLLVTVRGCLQTKS